MFQKKKVAFLLMLSMIMPGLAFGQSLTSYDAAAIDKIKDEGMNRSQAMATMKYLSDVIGGRLSNSPAQKRANQWTKEQLEKWGMKNAIIDPWGEFGRGWELKDFHSSVRVGNEFITFRSYPKAWSPSTNGQITGKVIYVDATDEAGLEKYKGKLKGAIVLVRPELPIRPGFSASASRFTDEELAGLEAIRLQPPTQVQGGPGGPGGNPNAMAAMQFNQRKQRFYFEEGVAVLVEPSSGTDSGTIRVMGASPAPAPAPAGQAGPGGMAGMRVYSADAAPTIPQLVAETEQYNRVYRLVSQGSDVQMTVNLKAEFYDDDLQGYNTLAEIPGTDLADEVVMLGGHLDSWHASNGSTDNGAGVTVSMEAMRILAASGLKPRRTIRVALWTGEEQGLLGSRGYVAKTFGSFENQDVPRTPPTGPRKFNKLPAYDKLSAYYNLDNGTGQIRGINMQSNEQLRPIFKKWLEPFDNDVYKAGTVSVRSVGGTDHQAYDGIGLPGFQFIQDTIEYNARTWHTTQDNADRTLENDLKISAIIMAAFVYNTAMADEKLPRKDTSFAMYSNMLTGFDIMAINDEAYFRKLGLGFQVCGHPITSNELPEGFTHSMAFTSIENPFDRHSHGSHAE